MSTSRSRKFSLLRWRVSIGRCFPLLVPGDSKDPRGRCGCSLRIEQSSIDGAGLGLFAATRIMQGAAVCIYQGNMLSTKEAFGLKRE